MEVFDIGAKIKLDSSEYTKGLGNASKETSNFGTTIKGAFSASMKVGAAAIGAVVTETVALSSALVKGVSDLAVYGDHIDKQSQKMNMSAQAYQEWDAILQHSGTSIDNMTMAMKTLSNAVETDSEEFATLGLNLEELKNMRSEEIFSRTITALQNVESDTQRTYLATKLLGRGATELGALLNTSAEDTEKMRQRVHELGGVMSDDAVKASAKFQDSLQDMKTSMAGLTRGITGEFLPSFTEVMDGLTAIFAGEEGGAEKVSNGIDKILENINSSTTKLKPIVKKIGGVITSAVKENAPKLINEGTQLLGDIVVSTIKNLPDIISTAGDVVGTIGSTISGNFSILKDTAFNLIRNFSGYLKDNLPTLIPEGIGMVTELAKGITDPENTGTLIDAAFDVIVGFVNGLTSPESIDKIITDAPIIVDNIVTGITNGASKLADAALQLTSNLSKYFGNSENRQKLKDCADKILDGIMQGFESLLGTGADAVYNIGGEIAKNIGLADYWTVGDEAMNDFWEGFKAEWKEFKKWFNLEIKDLLNPVNMVKSVSDSISGRITDLMDGEDSTLLMERPETAEVPQFIGPTLTGVPDKFKQKHGYHAKGGIFTHAVSIGGHTFGENGIEGLLPLENNTEWMDKLVDKLNKGGAKYEFNFYYQGGKGMSDEEIEEQAKRLAELSISQIRAVGGTGF